MSVKYGYIYIFLLHLDYYVCTFIELVHLSITFCSENYLYYSQLIVIFYVVKVDVVSVISRFEMYWTTHLKTGPRRVNHAAAAVGETIYTFGGYCTEEILVYRVKEPIDVHVLNISKSGLMFFITLSR